jgi:hypothetical protein
MTPLVVLLATIGVLVFVYRRARSRRIGPAAVGLFYEVLSEDKRHAVELIVEDKAEERDPEWATGTPHPVGVRKPNRSSHAVESPYQGW